MATTQIASEMPALRKRLTVEAREKAIAEAALAYFSKNGLAADTRGLAEQMGISQGLIFRYFPTKADLLDRVFATIERAEWHPIWERTLRDRSRTLEARLVTFYRSFLGQTDSPEWLRIIIHASLSGSDVPLRYYEDRFRAIIDIIAMELRQARGDPDDDEQVSDAEREAVFVLHGAVHYSLIRRHINRITPEPRDPGWVDNVVATFLRGALRIDK